MLLCLNTVAQIDPDDQNWECVLCDDFNETNRQFDNSFQEPLGKWISYAHSLWPSGVTKIPLKHIYQWDKCLIDATDGVIKLNSNFIRSTSITCSEQANYYDLPPNTFGMNYHCDADNRELYYYSGMIETVPTNKFRYGYFEIKCKLPVHRGAFPAFWLWGAKDNEYYEEIDIFEFSWDFENPASTEWTHNPHPHGEGNPYCFTSGLYINNQTESLSPIDSTSQARVYSMINDSLNHWHTFSCEWLPDHILWYCNGNLVNVYNNPDSIPSHPLTLKANYAIDRYALHDYHSGNIPEWLGSDVMSIDYIKVYQLDWDCSTDETITQQSELDNFDFAVKRRIAITSAIEPVGIGNDEKATFRATDSFEITGPFQVDNGGELTIIMQSCPNPE